MKNDPKEIPEVQPIPQTGQEAPILPEFIPEPKKHETIPKPEKEQDFNNPQT